MPAARRRLRLAAMAAALLVVIALGVGLRRALDPALTAGERELVGRWRHQLDGYPAGAFFDYEFRADRTCVWYNLDPKTGQMRVVGAGTRLTWRRSGDTLFVRHHDTLVAPRWDVLGIRRDTLEVSDLTPDGPGRFRYALNLRRTRPAQPAPVAGTLTRVPATD